jgi:exonuclease VII small subunit
VSEERARRNTDAQRASARPKRDDESSLPARDDADDDGRAPRNREPDVLLDVSELEVDKITLEVVGLRAHVSVVAQLANLVNLQVGVDARLDRVKLEIEGVRAKVLLKVWLDNVRAILEKALETLGEHPEILTGLIEGINRLLEGRLGDAVGALDDVLESLEEGGTVDALLKGRLEDVRGALEQVLEQVGGLEGEGRRGPLGDGPTNATTGEPTREDEQQ